MTGISGVLDCVWHKTELLLRPTIDEISWGAIIWVPWAQMLSGEKATGTFEWDWYFPKCWQVKSNICCLCVYLDFLLDGMVIKVVPCNKACFFVVDNSLSFASKPIYPSKRNTPFSG